MAKLRKSERRVLDDRTMGPEEKRELLDKILLARNELAKIGYEIYQE